MKFVIFFNGNRGTNIKVTGDQGNCENSWKTPLHPSLSSPLSLL